MKLQRMISREIWFCQQFIISEAFISCIRPTPVNPQEGCEWIVEYLMCNVSAEGTQNGLGSKVKNTEMKTRKAAR